MPGIGPNPIHDKRYEFVVCFKLRDRSVLSENEVARQLRHVLEENGCDDVCVTWEKARIGQLQHRSNQSVRSKPHTNLEAVDE